MGSIRIESDGTIDGTRIIDMYTGEQLDDILSVQITCDIDHGIIANIILLPSELDIIVEEDNINIDTDIDI